MGVNSRLNLYLRRHQPKPYKNTEREQKLVDKFNMLYVEALAEHESCENVKPANLDKWRKAYKGTLNALKRNGEESNRQSRQLYKTIFEIIESIVDNSIPMPKLKPRYKNDLPLVEITENYLKFEADRILTKYINDKSERATYIDGTSWYKVWWDSLDNTHERSGDVKIELCTADQIIPQPGVTDYKQLEYIFELKDVSVSRIYDLYGRIIDSESATGLVKTISCYYLNEDHVVGLFMWCPTTMQVICNEKDWQIRKLRKCTNCETINPASEECRVCGNTTFKYSNAYIETLEEDINEIYNPYDANETDDPAQKDQMAVRKFLTAGTEIPFYKITQLPFVPRPAISDVNSIYGISEAGILLDMQDMINKLATKSADKTLKSGAVVTKPQRAKISDTDESFKLLGVNSPEEAAMVQVKQIVADTSQDIILTNMMYDSAKSASGVTDSFQGKRDTTATSGKAKQYSAALTAGRIESLRVMKAAAFAGVYELILKYLLAFSDETRKFVKILPDGEQKEELWNKYMFLAKDKYGNIYYRDDFHFDSDTASTLSQNRAQMWQETQDKFIQGAFGNPADPRVLELFWNIMDSLQYPLAKVVLAGIKSNSQHLPPEIEQALMNNPQVLQNAVAQIEATQDKRGGARPNSGPSGNGASKAANMERTNERNRATNRSTIAAPQQMSANVGGQVG